MPDAKFTDGELKLFSVIMANLLGPINTDWEKVAEALNYKSVTVVKSRFSNIMRDKIKANQNPETPSTPKKSPSKAASPGKSSIRKPDQPRKAAPKTPTKRAKVERPDQEPLPMEEPLFQVKSEISDEGFYGLGGEIQNGHTSPP